VSAAYLPKAAKPADTAEAAAIGSETSTIGRGYRVLVVEDNDDVGQFSTELLEDLGYAVRRVVNADAALAILAKAEFSADLVFSDVIMPGTNDVELAGVIRERYPGLPVVLTSGYSNVLTENADRGFELIQKPYSVESLWRILRKAISERSPWERSRKSVGHPPQSIETMTTPARTIPSARAALVETSMIRPRTNGPRSLTRHWIELPR
jgi:DNA-binding NtrC family response regulator